jgi:phage tail sheath protein FI
MPEYLAPGVFVEETSFRSKSIEGVSTSTAAFIGPTRRGPVGEVSELLTRFGDFERVYGGLNDLDYSGNGAPPKTNYLAHAVFHFFNEGGARLYVSRVCAEASGSAASADLIADNPDTKAAQFVARFKGSGGNGKVVLEEIAVASSRAAAAKAVDGSLMRAKGDAQANPVIAEAYFVKRNGAWQKTDGTAHDFDAAEESRGLELLTLTVTAADADGNATVYEDLGYDPQHKRYVGAMLAENPARRDDQLTQWVALKLTGPVTPFDLRAAFAPPANQRTREVPLTGGTDAAPGSGDWTRALDLVEALDDVSIVAAPGASAYADREAVALALISHAEKRRAYRIAVLDTDQNLTPGGARQFKAKLDSKYAALYYPWVVAANPLARPDRPEVPREVKLPPSGFVCGIYARSDIERGVFKAPANEVIRAALRFERLISTGEQEQLNPLGVNCLRFFPGRGHRVWGARTTSSDPEWKYVNVRRYFNYLEHSIDRGTQWAVFEPNGERLWANVRDTVASFLFNEWVNGALLGDKPEQAFFVRCDRSTMTQNDLDNGRLICLIGVAFLKPAEFVIFRIGQKTADARG